MGINTQYDISGRGRWPRRVAVTLCAVTTLVRSRARTGAARRNRDFGGAIYTSPAITQYAYTRWHKVLWWNHARAGRTCSENPIHPGRRRGIAAYAADLRRQISRPGGASSARHSIIATQPRTWATRARSRPSVRSRAGPASTSSLRMCAPATGCWPIPTHSAPQQPPSRSGDGLDRQHHSGQRCTPQLVTQRLHRGLPRYLPDTR